MDDFFRVYIASSKHQWGWLNSWKLANPWDSQRDLSDLPNFYQTRGYTRSLYSGWTCGSEGTDWRPCGTCLAKSLLNTLPCLHNIEGYGDFGTSWCHKTKTAGWKAGPDLSATAKSTEKEYVNLWLTLSRGDIQNDGNHPTPQNNERIPRAFLKTSIK